MNAGKRKRDDFASQYQTSGFIPQQDGAVDADSSVFEIEVLFPYLQSVLVYFFFRPWTCMPIFFYIISVSSLL